MKKDIPFHGFNTEVIIIWFAVLPDLDIYVSKNVLIADTSLYTGTVGSALPWINS